MIFDVENTKGKKVELRDSMGKPVKFCRRYDTATRCATILVVSSVDGGKARFAVTRDGVATAEVYLPGSVIEVDGSTY